MKKWTLMAQFMSLKDCGGDLFRIVSKSSHGFPYSEKSIQKISWLVSKASPLIQIVVYCAIQTQMTTIIYSSIALSHGQYGYGGSIYGSFLGYLPPLHVKTIASGTPLSKINFSRSLVSNFIHNHMVNLVRTECKNL